MTEWMCRLPGSGPAEPCDGELGPGLAWLVLSAPVAGKRRLNHLSAPAATCSAPLKCPRFPS
jgi:hypothetical protein